MTEESRRIEIVGVAGTGKSTLTRALVDSYAECRIADSLHTRLPAHWPYVAHSLPRVLPLITTTMRGRPRLSWDEAKFVIYVSEWSRYLGARPEHRVGITILDQGPIFALARLLWGGTAASRSSRFQDWMREMVEHWAVELDEIAWLDAPDHVLLRRIDSRSQGHEAKGRSREDALELIDSHRRAYARLRDLLDAAGGPPVLDLDTFAATPADLSRELGRIFEEKQWLTNRNRVLNVR